MKPVKYNLLLNDCLKVELMALSEKMKDRLLEKFSYLENGIWDTGVRVKKLKGTGGKVIFEARIDRGNRLIFTLGRQADEACIYIWGAVRHDDISAAARSVLPDNAPFLTFEPLEEEQFDDVLFDDLPDAYFTQESIEDKVKEDYGSQKWLDIREEREWQRLLAKKHPDLFEIFLYLTIAQRRVLEQLPPVLISGTAGSGKTTIAVYMLLRQAHNGKRLLFLTCSRYLKDFSQHLYKGLTARPDPRNQQNTSVNSVGEVHFAVLTELIRDILTSRGVLLDPVKEVTLREFRMIFSKHALARKYDPELVWEEIRSIIKGANPPLNLKRYRELGTGYIRNRLSPVQLRDFADALLELKNMDFMHKIIRILHHHTQYPDFDSFIGSLMKPTAKQDPGSRRVVEEILRILEAKQNRFERPLLSINEYLNLGRKRAPNFLYDREDIYTIAEYYQRQLETENRYDEIDLCRTAIQALDANRDQFLWDVVVCDEIQDFSDIQLALVFRLSRAPGSLVCAGDTRQIINPSGFRWEEVKQRFFERGIDVPEVHQLNLNFRSTGSIVKLSNALLDLKQQLVGLSGYEQREDWKFNGRPPFVVLGIKQEDMLSSLGRIAAGSVILVRTGDEQRKLKKALGTELVFTVQEAKGLEFDTVLLWKFSAEQKSQAVWRKIVGDSCLEQEHYPLIRHEINLLYVAVTRSRNTLIIYDGLKGSPVWDLEAVKSLIVTTRERKDLTQVWKQISTPKEWGAQGQYFYEREYYSAAFECFRNADNQKMADLSRAWIHAADGYARDAAVLFDLHGHRREAAEQFERAGDYQNAAEAWKKAKELHRARLCTVHLLEASGDYLGAASQWMKLNQTDKALHAWQRAGAWKELARYCQKHKDYADAAEYYQRARMDADAAECWKKAGQPQKAADLFFRLHDYESAEKLYKRLRDHDKLLNCYQKMGDSYREGIELERRKDYTGALAAYTLFTGSSKRNADQLLQEAAACKTPRMQIKAALRLSAAGRSKDAAVKFFARGQYALARDEYVRCGDLQQAGECAVSLGEALQAVKLFEQLNTPETRRRSVQVLNASAFDGYGFDNSKANAIYKEAQNMFSSGDYSRAITRMMALNMTEDVLDTCGKVSGRDEEILDFFLFRKKYDFAEKALSKRRSLQVSSLWLKGVLEHIQDSYIWYESENIRNLRKFGISLLYGCYDLLDERTAEAFAENLMREYLNYPLFESLPSKLELLALKSNYINMLYSILFRSFDRETDRYKGFLEKVLGYESLLPEYQILKMMADSASSNNPDRNTDSAVTQRVIRSRGFAQKIKPAGGADVEKLLAVLPATEKNFYLFENSPVHFRKAVTLLVEIGDTDRAVLLLQNHRKIEEAGSLLETAGDYKEASRLYRDNRAYEDAARCCLIAGDQMGLARIYERMERFDEAVAIWKKLKKTKEIERVKRKIAKLKAKGKLKPKPKRKPEPEQLDLF